MCISNYTIYSHSGVYIQLTEQIDHVRSYPIIIYQVEVGRFILLVHILYRVQYRTKFDENCRCEELSYKGEVKHTYARGGREGWDSVVNYSSG